MTATVSPPQSDIRDFADTVRRICGSAPTPDTWRPTAICDDRNGPLRSRLTEAGWFEVAAEPAGAEFLGAAAVELGRALAPLDVVDGLLGHSVALSAELTNGPALARYVAAGSQVWLCGMTGAALTEVTTVEPVRYVDAQAVAIIEVGAAVPGCPEHRAVDAWTAAMTGYLAGLCAGALELAGGHAGQRIAFGRPLTDIDAVAKKIADCATASEGLQMAAHRGADPYVLQQAPATAFKVVRACHQILGGLGFTLEYPLQRYSRRVDALRVWTPAIVTALTRCDA
jgi:alkylation response protein AidB-like acyl-CoA dehydrogenase